MLNGVELRWFYVVVGAFFYIWIPFQIRAMRPAIEEGVITAEQVSVFFRRYAVFLALTLVLLTAYGWRPPIPLLRATAGIALVLLFAQGAVWVILRGGDKVLAPFAPAFNFPKVRALVVRWVVGGAFILNATLILIELAR